MSVMLDSIEESTISKQWHKTEEICGKKWNRNLDHGYSHYDPNNPSKNYFEYEIKVANYVEQNHLRWCGENCIGQFYRTRDKIPDGYLKILSFELKDDAIFFKMRWV